MSPKAVSIFVFGIHLALLAAPETPAQGAAREATEHRNWSIGSELDALPFALGGYYGSLWLGIDRVKLRAVVAQANPPAFTHGREFSDNRLFVLAGIADFYFQDGFRGFWIGAGAERWDASIREKSTGTRAEYADWVLTLGGGYAWYFWRGAYLNPWAAFHFVAWGDTEVTVGSAVFEPARFTPEGSLS